MKKSGSKTYTKIMGNEQDLRRASRRVREPVKPASGRNPAHVDCPARKIGWLKGLLEKLILE